MATQVSPGVRQFVALIGKDLRLHGRTAALTIAGTLLLFAAAMRLSPQADGPRISLVFNVNALATLLWSDWLIARERSKRTFAWLRALPVDDRALVGAKFALAAAWCIACWLLSSALFAREFWRPPGTGLTVQCALLAFGGLSIATKWRFPWQIGQIAPMVILLVPVLLLATFAGDGTVARETLLAMWRTPLGRLATAASLLAVYAAIVAVTVRWVTRADTSQLVD